jgi:sulfur-oxidizing protein SoxY
MTADCTRLTRRGALAAAGTAAIAVILLPRLVSASPAQVEEEIKKLYGDKALGAGKINLDVPSIAENGLVVPISVSVESPMTETDFVKAVHVFADGNPNAAVASFFFTPELPKASVQTRMRLAQSQNIVAVAELSDGSLYTAKKEIKVTIGGCGG